MKKKQLANMLMVAVIAVILAAGITAAALLRGGTEPAAPDGTSATFSDTGSGSYTCTVEISCEEILSNPDLLDEAKAPYVPRNGYILAETAVTFTEGETVFDILQRVCRSADIQLEYSWTPLYDSHYVEGIGHIYEFDCGAESGWVYQVNGESFSYGGSGRKVEPGDAIVWSYTCGGTEQG